MTVAQFDRGYWFATDLRAFAQSIGLPSALELRKNELEAHVRRYLTTGKVGRPRRPPSPRTGRRDVARGLRLSLPVRVYTNDVQTKAFIEREARTMWPAYRRRSGARYRLNRWREAQLARGRAITYRDLVREYVRLSRPEERYVRIPHGRYINFLSDFLRIEPDAGRAAAIRAWHEVKRLDLPKTYRAWRQHTRPPK